MGAERAAVRAVMTAGACLVLALTACAGQAGNARLSEAEASGDGTLRIGLILDNVGDRSFLNDSQRTAARLAVQEINAAGGHKGKPVELLPEKVNEDASGQARELVAAKADVVIGPTDSSNAGEAIDVLARAKVTLISPANTAMALSKYKSGGYYFRTAAADVAQASVLAKLAKDGGARSVAVIHEAGSYGADVLGAVKSAASQADLDIAVDAEFTPGDARGAAAKAKDSAPDAVILVARQDAVGAIAELNNAGLGGKKLILSDGAVDQYGSRLGSKALDGSRGVLPGTFPSAHFQGELVAVNAQLKDMTFAAETYDAANLAAIAAAAAQDDAGASIASHLLAVSGGRTASEADRAADAQVCKTYQECAEAIRLGKTVDYDGESGAIAFDSSGDITSANYMVFTYGADNTAKMSGTESAAKDAG
ncbi:ABC transporter substrate-binding protein [Arthrobacter sp.]|uniref:ABC transporter substrate-binding protein n=1 Tax=Arthrobacter sp. TaxID=1667 RepID=UPI002811D721|nr:ABC transporter substrate-binding protein [Arthrobacter sp.]